MCSKSTYDLMNYNKTEKAKVAVVVPVYNAEKYLEECLKSVRNQTFKHWTCFVVNDGSKDSSRMIAESFASSDSRFIVLHKENGGVSSARNVGIHLAVQNQFDFISFLDSDDFLPENYLDVNISALQNEKADMSVCSLIQFDKNGVVESKYDNAPIYQVLTEDLIADMYFLAGKGKVKRDYSRFLGNKTFRLSTIGEKLFCESMKTAEDQDWMIDNLLKIKRAVCTSDTGYYYRLRKSSLSRTSGLFQDFKTFERILSSSYSQYSSFVQECIQNRYVETFYNEIIHAIQNNADRTSIQNRLAVGKETIAGNFSHAKFSNRELRRLRRLSWPFWLLCIYAKFQLRKNIKLQVSRQQNYFD